MTLTHPPLGANDPATPAPNLPDGAPLGRRGTRILIAVGVLILLVPLAVFAWLARGNTPATPPLTNGPTGTTNPSASAVPTAPTGTPTTSPTAALPSRYTAIHLPKLAGSTTYGTFAFALNDNGQAVGQSEAANGRLHPVLWQNGKITDLGVLAPGPAEAGMALDINAAGDIVGASESGNGQRAVLWRGGHITNLGTLGGDQSLATAINDHDQIVGESTTAAGDTHGFLWENGHMTDLGLPARADPRDINNLGQVVGAMNITEQGAGQAFLWQNGVVTPLPSPQPTSSAVSINDNGEIVGGYSNLRENVASHAVRWYHGVLTELGALASGDASGAAAINDLGQIIGRSNVAPHSDVEHAFVWWQGGLHDLTAAGIAAGSTDYDINNRGQIVAGLTLYTPA
ncbi:MAG: hypothetical protein ACM3JP_02675 [Betaproteobacteria bacterium]